MGVHVAPLDEPEVCLKITDIYRSTLVRDVLTRNSIRAADMFDQVAAFTIDNAGSPVSARRASEFMKSQRRPVSHETVQNYLRALAVVDFVARAQERTMYAQILG